MKTSKRTWLIKARKEKGLSRADMVSFLGITQQAYCYIENGDRRPTPELAQKIGKILDIDWTEFYKKRRYKQGPEKEE